MQSDCCNSATSTQALEYIPDVDLALDEITRVLKPGGAFVNVSILWDHFKFYGADEKLNEKVHDAFKAHCNHQMLPMELPGKLERRGFRNIKDKSLAFVITRRDGNSPARYTEEIMANFALTQGMSEEEVSDWKSQLEKAEQQGRFGRRDVRARARGGAAAERQQREAAAAERQQSAAADVSAERVRTERAVGGERAVRIRPRGASPGCGACPPRAARR